MEDWAKQVVQEKQKLNQLGNESLEKGIPLFQSEAVQAQIRKVDALILRLHKQKAECDRELL